ncbi:MAG TPA: YggS family pyridoxal phosphate-dependent enzyme [Candidatus Baltobacteraceae bacterium]|nr:YggS family pyridoxal phosphate-dependent enzyme [Candidatus Baltobacteraceae bacterium]
MNGSFAARLAELRAQIDEELRACGREPGSVRIVGVSKRQPAAAIAQAALAGLDAIGENYVQEAAKKFADPAVRELHLEKHFIGHVQTNKAKALLELFDVVQSVDRPDAARALGKAAAAAGRVLPVLLQVNVSPSERFGVAPAEAGALAGAVAAQPGLRLDGVMAIGPLGADRDQIARAFELAAKTFAAVGGSTLSIGMSGDWREAVRAGSTMVRIGTALFGGRSK